MHEKKEDVHPTYNDIQLVESTTNVAYTFLICFHERMRCTSGILLPVLVCSRVFARFVEDLCALVSQLGWCILTSRRIESRDLHVVLSNFSLFEVD